MDCALLKTLLYVKISNKTTFYTQNYRETSRKCHQFGIQKLKRDLIILITSHNEWKNI